MHPPLHPVPCLLGALGGWCAGGWVSADKGGSEAGPVWCEVWWSGPGWVVLNACLAGGFVRMWCYRGLLCSLGHAALESQSTPFGIPDPSVTHLWSVTSPRPSLHQGINRAVSGFPGEANVGTAVLLGISAGRRHPVPDLIATAPPGLHNLDSTAPHALET